jgi:hypothetical protein
MLYIKAPKPPKPVATVVPAAQKYGTQQAIVQAIEIANAMILQTIPAVAMPEGIPALTLFFLPTAPKISPTIAKTSPRRNTQSQNT